jgi:hypothetical protein
MVVEEEQFLCCKGKDPYLIRAKVVGEDAVSSEQENSRVKTGRKYWILVSARHLLRPNDRVPKDQDLNSQV